MASSSSSSTLLNIKYDVFLSFRGEDTRHNFTSHLYHALQRKKIKTFMDHKLNRGEEIAQNLIDAIKESKISVIVFSENYANSKWCLNELLMILDCRDAPLNQIVMPVFYKVDPTNVRHQTGEFGSAFDTALKESQVEEARWRSALDYAGTLSGWHLSKDSSEASIVDTIVDAVWQKLLEISSNNCGGCRELVGMNSRIDKIMSLLCVESHEFGMVGIWGMGGVGKTTLAEQIFHIISCQFESFCFLINVREKTESDLVSMRDDLISKLLKEDKLDIGTPSIGDPYIRDRLRRTRVLVVIDDVDKSSQLEVLIGERESVLFGPGSVVIVTCRDRQVLNFYDMARLYNMETLQDDEALQLFRYYAFHPNQSPEPYLEFSKIIVEYAKGVALPLKVLGSSLRGKNELHWKSALTRLREVPNKVVSNVLKISYDGLNTCEKDMFLDIACFFKGEDRESVTKILDGCYGCAYEGIEVLIDKSLITISQNKKLEMHDLLQEMGWNIVLQESEEPGSRSRLWLPEDVYDVLTRNTGTEKIKGIFFDVSQVNEMNLDSQVFAKMCNLKFLRIYDSSSVDEELSRVVFPNEELMRVVFPGGKKSKVHFPYDLKSLPDELRYLSWFACPLECFPSAFRPDNLVELDMFGGSFERLWTRPQTLVSLKALRLECCWKLVDIPDLSSCTNLEELDLKGCLSLVEIPSSIEHLNKLKRLDLDYCSTLESLSSMDHLHKLTHLNLFECINLVEIPSSIENLNCLTNLVLTLCESLVAIPYSIGNIKSLTNFSLSCCYSLVQLPSSIGNLNNLTNLSFYFCRSLVEIPSSIGNLSNLTKFILYCCDRLVDIPSSIGNLNNLTNLSLMDSSSLVEIPSSIGNLNRLANLDLRCCTSLVEIPSSIGDLNNLANLDLTGCTNLEKLPNSINLASLTHLGMRNCRTITEFPFISTNIKVLEVDMTLIERIPSSLALLIGLKNLTLFNLTEAEWSPSFLEDVKRLTPMSCKIEVKPEEGKEVNELKELLESLRNKWSKIKGRLPEEVELKELLKPLRNKWRKIKARHPEEVDELRVLLQPLRNKWSTIKGRILE